jgi:hypothetical protein
VRYVVGQHCCGHLHEDCVQEIRFCNKWVPPEIFKMRLEMNEIIDKVYA